MDALDLFRPQVRDWFARRFDAPTDIQRQAWPVIAGGERALLTAPTGSGKTLTAFLRALDRLESGTWKAGTGLDERLPPQLATTWLVYRGSELVCVLRRSGRQIETHGPLEREHLGVFHELLDRGAGRIEVKEIDGRPAAESRHAGLLEGIGFCRGRKSPILKRRYA